MTEPRPASDRPGTASPALDSGLEAGWLLGVRRVMERPLQPRVIELNNPLRHPNAREFQEKINKQVIKNEGVLEGRAKCLAVWAADLWSAG